MLSWSTAIRRLARHQRTASTLLELVILVALLGILAAIVIPRMSRGAKGAGNTALAGDLRVLRDSIDRYSVDHGGRYPGRKDIVGQLTQFTDCDGDVQANADKTHRYGPYLQRVPPLPVGEKKGATGIASNAGDSIGWVYDEGTAAIRPNCGPEERDDAGVAFRDY